MKLRKIWKNLPILPTTALIFYLFVILLWNINLIPPPTEIVNFLEGLYNEYGLLGLFIAAFLEGIVYLGLYFPGSLVIALAVFFSNGSFVSLLNISIVVTIALTITAFINYFLGKHISFKENNKISEHKESNKGLFASMIHPNILAFYFFNEGIEKRGLWKIVFIPLGMIPYGLFLAYFLYIFSDFARQRFESPLFLFSLIVIWLVIAFILDHKRKIKREFMKISHRKS